MSMKRRRKSRPTATKESRTTTESSDSPFPNDYNGWIGDEVAVVDAASLDSATFIRDFVTPRRPCLIRGLLDCAEFAPLKRWTDTSYLRDKCADAAVRVESRATTADRYGVGNEQTMKAKAVLIARLLCKRLICVALLISS